MVESGMQSTAWILCILMVTTQNTVCPAYDSNKLDQDANNDIQSNVLDPNKDMDTSVACGIEVTRVRCLITQCKRKTGEEFIQCVTKCQELPMCPESKQQQQQQQQQQQASRDKREASPFWKRSAPALLRSAFWKRQSDPLQSCIEAHCTSTFHRSYGACVYEKCMHTLHMRLFRGTNKRSWNDMVHTCIAFHCGSQTPGTYSYGLCVQKSCGNSLIGER